MKKILIPGDRCRSSDNKLIEKKLGWKPKYSLKKDLKKTYHWIFEEIIKS